MSLEKLTESLSKAKRKRGVARTSISKILSKIEGIVQNPDIEVNNDLEELLEHLNEKSSELKAIDSEIESLVDEEKLEAELISAEEYREKITSWRFRATKKLRDLNSIQKQEVRVAKEATPNEDNSKQKPEVLVEQKATSSDEKTIRETKEKINVKLPKLTIAKFFGDHSEWLSFWSSFETAIHKNESLDPIDKFNYLKAYLGGSAQKSIEGLAMTAAHYDTAIKILKERFGNKETLINAHMCKLLNIPPLKNSDDTKAFRNMYDKIQTQIRSLECLEVPTDSYGSLLCPILMKILPRDLTLDFNKEHDSKYTLKEIMDFLFKQLNSRERTCLDYVQREFVHPHPRRSTDWRNQNKTKFDSEYMHHDKFSERSKKDSNVKFEPRKNAKEFNSRYNRSYVKRDNISDRKCFKCGEPGHLQNRCELRNESNSLKIERNEEVFPNTYVKEVKINGSKGIVSLVDTGSSVSLLKESVAKKLNLPFKPERKKLFGFGNTENASAFTIGKIPVQLQIDEITAEVELFIVSEGVQPYDLIIGRDLLDKTEIALARIGSNLHIWYGNNMPYSQLQSDCEKNRIELLIKDALKLESNSINFIQAKTDGIKNGIVMLEGKDDNLDSILEISDGKTVIPIVNSGPCDVKFRENQCLGRVLDISDEWELNDSNDQNVNTETRDTDKKEIKLDDVKFDESTPCDRKIEIVKLISEYRDCFALTLSELGCTDFTKMEIREVEGSRPVCLRPYRASASERSIIKNIVKEWKDNGIVSDTRSPYASPVLLVKKKTGENRLVVDFRRLNSQTVKDKFPLPRIDDLLECLNGCKIFTTLDLAHGYLQIPLSDQAKIRTAFITPDETGQFERMIFGLANAPAEFQRLMHQVLGPLLNTKALCYLDDILIPAKSWDEMTQRIEEVFERLREAKLTLRLSKCEFGKQEVEFLGFIINSEGLKPGLRKIKAIEDFPTPTNVHEVRRFLGLTSFFRRFVKKYAHISEPLTRLTQKNKKFEWKEEQVKAFQTLRNELIVQPIVAHYDPNAKTEVHCDASSIGIAGMLLQQGNDDKWHMVYCVSKKNSEAESKYHSSKLELMAIVWTLDRLRQFLLGIKFTIVTDCQALIYLNAKKSLNPQMARWYNLIQDYDFDVRHRPGEKMSHVDAMSRSPVTEESEDTLDSIIEKKLEVSLTLTEEEQILMIQHADNELKEIIKIFQKAETERTAAEKRKIDGYEFKKNRLFRKVKIKDEERLLYAIPKSMRKSLVVKFHDLMGHFSVERTVNKIKELYWFPYMKRYVRRHISMCFECLVNKVPAGKQQGLLHPIKAGQRPFSVIHLDHLGPFVKSSKGNQELLVVIDNFTRFVQLTPMKSTKTSLVMKAIDDFVNNFGLPDKIISDRGTCFTSLQFQNFCTENGIHHVLNSTKHPRANGMVERANRTVLSAITTSMKDKTHRDWDKKIKQVERNLNNFVNKSTNKTPFEMLHGYSPRFNDGLMRHLVDDDCLTWTEPEKIQDEARKEIEKSQEKMKENFDKKRCKAVIYEPGEIVVMKRAPQATGQPTKTQPKYRGPLSVTKVLPSDTYRVTQLEDKEKGHFFTTTAHASQLKPWKCAPDSDIDSDGEDDHYSDDDDSCVDPAIDAPRRNPRRSTRKD